MTPFTYTRATTVSDAIHAHAGGPDSQYIGGGTNLLDLMKMDVEHPARLIDITRLPLNRVEENDGGLRIGALVTNTDAANHPLVRSRYPVLSEAILSGATQQLRNKATMGGNLLQRTRCYYFYDSSYTQCNKRKPGSGCAAKEGYQRLHAILGASPECIATNPSDMSVALAALDATVQVEGPHGVRSIPFAQFHRLPGAEPQFDTTLKPGELITAIDLPAIPYATRSRYLKTRDRNSYAFALVSVAAVLDMQGDTIKRAHIALGGVAHKPWRASKAEHLLAGQKLDDAIFKQAANAELASARPYPNNTFKVELAKRAMARCVRLAAEVNA
jgi:xanthine dehydrogenase YagS FAD-binding subunit